MFQVIQDGELQATVEERPMVSLDNDLLQQRFLNKRQRAQEAFIDNYQSPQGKDVAYYIYVRIMCLERRLGWLET